MPANRRIPNFRLRTDPKKLAAVALQAFSESGYLQTSVESIASRLGLSKSAIYLRFPSKRTLLNHVVQEFSVEDDLEVANPDKLLASLVTTPAAPPGLVLRLVLREWSAMPELATFYFETLVNRVAARTGSALPETGRLITAVLKVATFSVVFDPGRSAHPFR